MIRQERVSNKFERTIELPTAVDPDKVEASLTAGVLTVKFAKPEAVKPTSRGEDQFVSPASRLIEPSTRPDPGSSLSWAS